eukprot:TRINITY_DN591_c0_g1_i4.p1 TRINITY_DN591_c0_g1~~TRINITY_DN591_c0_g1_i4.p1  ORF type:complete len:883 (-),score=102.18 TRINITY_DN591_c0_g1_i4:663-3311(-)
MRFTLTSIVLCAVTLGCCQSACLYRLDSRGWSYAGHENDYYALGSVQDLAVSPEYGVIAVGKFAIFSPSQYFVDIGSVPFQIDEWRNFPNFTRLATSISEVFGINRVFLNGTSLFIGGIFEFYDGPSRLTGVAYIQDITLGPNAIQWLPLGAGVDGEVNCLAVSGRYVYIGGRFNTVNAAQLHSPDFGQFDMWAQQWVLPQPTWPVHATALHTNASVVWCADMFQYAQTRLMITTAATTQWAPHSAAIISGIVVHMAFVGDTVYIAGRFWAIDGVAYAGLARYDAGNGWISMGSSSTSYTGASSVTSSIGSSTTDGSSTGSTSSSSGSGGTIGSSATRSSDRSSSSSPGDSSSSTTASSTTASSTAASSATASSSSTSGGTIGASAFLGVYMIKTLLVNGTDVFVGGLFDSIGDATSPCLARYNTITDTWHSMPPGFFGMVRSLAIHGDTMYAGVWKYTPLADQSWINNLILSLSSLSLFILAALVVYFIVMRVRTSRGVKSPRHETFLQWFSTFIVVVALAVVAWTLDVPAETYTIASTLLDVSIEEADQYRINGYIIEYAIAGALCPFVGYLSNIVSTRALLTVSLCTTLLSTFLEMFMMDVAMLEASKVFTGIAYGICFTAALSYYARASSRYVVGPMLAFFYFKRSAPLFINDLTQTLYEFGLDQRITGHSFFALIVIFLVILLLLLGFQEQPLDPVRLSLREQLHVRIWPLIVLLLFLIVVNVATISFEFYPQFYIHSRYDSLIFLFCTFGAATLILLTFVWLSYWRHKGPQFLTILSSLLLTAGYTIVVVCMFTLPADTSQINNHVQQAPFYLGSIIASSTGNMVQAVICALFVGIITQTSKGTLVGVFGCVGILSRFFFFGPIRQNVIGYTPTYV